MSVDAGEGGGLKELRKVSIALQLFLSDGLPKVNFREEFQMEGGSIISE